MCGDLPPVLLTFSLRGAVAKPGIRLAVCAPLISHSPLIAGIAVPPSRSSPSSDGLCLNNGLSHSCLKTGRSPESYREAIEGTSYCHVSESITTIANAPPCNVGYVFNADASVRRMSYLQLWHRLARQPTYWIGRDSNPRTQKRGDLQSPCFNLSQTYPMYLFLHSYYTPLGAGTRIRLWCHNPRVCLLFGALPAKFRQFRRDSSGVLSQFAKASRLMRESPNTKLQVSHGLPHVIFL